MIEIRCLNCCFYWPDVKACAFNEKPEFIGYSEAQWWGLCVTFKLRRSEASDILAAKERLRRI